MARAAALRPLNVSRKNPGNADGKTVWRQPPSAANSTAHAPVAQLDRALPSEGRGHRFESCRVHHQSRHVWSHPNGHQRRPAGPVPQHGAAALAALVAAIVARQYCRHRGLRFRSRGAIGTSTFRTPNRCCREADRPCVERTLYKNGANSGVDATAIMKISGQITNGIGYYVVTVIISKNEPASYCFPLCTARQSGWSTSKVDRSHALLFTPPWRGKQRYHGFAGSLSGLIGSPSNR
jgi:hypothetical protein